MRYHSRDKPAQIYPSKLKSIPSSKSLPLLEAEVDIILLDNFSHEDLSKAIHMINGQACTEASGGISLETLPRLSSLGLDFISTGSPVHQSQWKDIGLDWI